jgi:hypothetical protein
MPKAIEEVSGSTLGHVGLGYRGDKVGSVRQQVHDGDTIEVRTIGNFGVRLLGVDAPEISYNLPGESDFTEMSDPKWDAFLANPFAQGLPAFNPPLASGLRQHLRSHIGVGVAANHYRLAVAAQKALEEEILKDIKALGQSEETFQFILVFAYEVMDRYGRFLALINRNQPDPSVPAPRPPTYNLRLLQQAKICPYFIWPNVDPFRKTGSLVKAVIPPGKANEVAEGAETLRLVRQSMRNARKLKTGIFDKQDPLKLEPFEVRFLARRFPPDRWVIDLSRSDDKLINPQKYYSIPHAEDRLYIPEEYVPLFVEAGWKRQV